MDHNDQADAEDRDYCADKFLDEMEELREENAALRAEVERLQERFDAVRDAAHAEAKRVFPETVVESHFGGELHADDLCSMLATEIERLRDAAKLADEMYEQAATQANDYAAQRLETIANCERLVEQIKAEVERLREAVLTAYRKGHHHTVNGGYQWCDQGGREVVEEIIREAMEE